MKPDNPYTKMQVHYYSRKAELWDVDDTTEGVGVFEDHNNWTDYETYLFQELDTDGKLGLDFGCGPGRNLVKFHDRFARLDGVDLCRGNLENARKWLEKNGVSIPKLHLCNGVDLRTIPSNSYDILMSTICLQHIPIYDIRHGYLKEFFRVLKPGGWVTLQMGYGKKGNKASYYENRTNAKSTNGGLDVYISTPDEPKKDLEEIGFVDFKHWIRPSGPGDCAPNWIFFRARKP